MSAFLERLLSALTHPLAEPIGRRLADLESSLLGCLMPMESLLHGLNHLHPSQVSFAFFHEHLPWKARHGTERQAHEHSNHAAPQAA